MSARTVAALYVDPGGPYPQIPGVEIWDETRDARLYTGPHPVVAHPPCERWCKMAKFVESQWGYQVGDDGGIFELALATVRRWGGVLEHPAWSLAWPRFALPQPPARGWARSFERLDEWVCEVAQGAYNHDAQKLTWLLLVGALPPTDTNWSKPRGKKTLTRFAQRHPGDHNNARTHAERVSGDATHITPLAFAEMLVGLARAAHAPGGA
jgi:hypothetical protein